MYSAPLREKEPLPHQLEREAWARRLRDGQEKALPVSTGGKPRAQTVPGLSGDAALVGLILFLLSDRTKNDMLLLCVLVYLLFS